MIRLFILVALGVVLGLLVVKIFSKKNGDNGVVGELIDAGTDARRPSILLVLLLGAVLAGLVLFILPRFGVSVMGLLQKVLAFLPLLRGFLPF